MSGISSQIFSENLSQIFSVIEMLTALFTVEMINVDTFKSLASYLLHVDGTVLWRTKMAFLNELVKLQMWALVVE